MPSITNRQMNLFLQQRDCRNPYSSVSVDGNGGTFVVSALVRWHRNAAHQVPAFRRRGIIIYGEDNLLLPCRIRRIQSVADEGAIWMGTAVSIGDLRSQTQFIPSSLEKSCSAFLAGPVLIRAWNVPSGVIQECFWNRWDMMPSVFPFSEVSRHKYQWDRHGCILSQERMHRARKERGE